jgi:hypothetical protein
MALISNSRSSTNLDVMLVLKWALEESFVRSFRLAMLVSEDSFRSRPMAASDDHDLRTGARLQAGMPGERDRSWGTGNDRTIYPVGLGSVPGRCVKAPDRLESER